MLLLLCAKMKHKKNSKESNIFQRPLWANSDASFIILFQVGRNQSTEVICHLAYILLGEKAGTHI
jgi:hypothetical protein